MCVLAQGLADSLLSEFIIHARDEYSAYDCKTYHQWSVLLVYNLNSSLTTKGHRDAVDKPEGTHEHDFLGLQACIDD